VPNDKPLSASVLCKCVIFWEMLTILAICVTYGQRSRGRQEMATSLRKTFSGREQTQTHSLSLSLSLTHTLSLFPYFSLSHYLYSYYTHSLSIYLSLTQTHTLPLSIIVLQSLSFLFSLSSSYYTLSLSLILNREYIDDDMFWPLFCSPQFFHSRWHLPFRGLRKFLGKIFSN